MKLTPSPIEIEEHEGFAPEKDIFQRVHFAEELYNLIDNVDDELVIALDAPWGEGKTTFVKMWRGMLNAKGVESIYFDAFKNDYLEDPFLAMVGEVYSLLGGEKNKDVKKEFKAKAVSAIKTIGKAGIRIGLKAITAAVLDDTALKGAGAEKEISDISDKYISKRLDTLEADKSSIDDFRKMLSSVALTIGGEHKIVFIIDELDRCKPSFALDLLEKIKHIFSIPGIIFVLVMNRGQMDEIIKSRYGLGIDSTKYLQKFVHVWCGLPKSNGYTSNGKIYLRNCLSRMDFEITTRTQQTGIELYEELIVHYNMSPREIERSLTNFAIIHNIFKGNLNSDYLWLSIYLSIEKVLFPNCYRQIMLGNITYEEVIKETNLQTLEADYWKADKPEGHPIRWLLKYYLSNEEDAKALLTHGNFLESRDYGRSALKNICRWLDSFKRNNE